MIKLICAQCMSDDIHPIDNKKDEECFKCNKCKNEFIMEEAMWEETGF